MIIDLHTVTCLKIQPCALAFATSIFAHAIRSPKLAFDGFKPENLMSSLLVELIQTVFPVSQSLATIPKETKRSSIQLLSLSRLHLQLKNNENHLIWKKWKMLFPKRKLVTSLQPPGFSMFFQCPTLPSPVATSWPNVPRDICCHQL